MMQFIFILVWEYLVIILFKSGGSQLMHTHL